MTNPYATLALNILDLKTLMDITFKISVQLFLKGPLYWLFFLEHTVSWPVCGEKVLRKDEKGMDKQQKKSGEAILTMKPTCFHEYHS